MTELLERSCPICHSKENKYFLTCIDKTVSEEKFNIVKCGKCDFHFTNPIPFEKNIANYYKSENYISHSDTAASLQDKLYHLIRKYTVKQKTKLIQSVNNGKTDSLLDIGCGTGYFLQYAQKKGWVIHGFEPDGGARKIAEENTGHIIWDSIERIQHQTFKIITLWHVLEHVYDLSHSLKLIKESLHKDGKLIIAVPNYESFDAGVYQQYWAAYDVPRHLYHFSKKTLTHILNNYNLTIQEIRPMYFDSYYVSLISEKYKGTKNPISVMWNSLVNGTRSNINKNNTSSLLYIVSHS